MNKFFEEEEINVSDLTEKMGRVRNNIINYVTFEIDSNKDEKLIPIKDSLDLIIEELKNIELQND
jgi:hypothetical protein